LPVAAWKPTSIKQTSPSSPPPGSRVWPLRHCPTSQSPGKNSPEKSAPGGETLPAAPNALAITGALQPERPYQFVKVRAHLVDGADCGEDISVWALGQLLFDRALAREQPVHGAAECVLIGLSHSKVLVHGTGGHQRVVASLVCGATMRAASTAHTRSRSAQGRVFQSPTGSWWQIRPEHGHAGGTG
jgi:hypothetical protein